MKGKVLFSPVRIEVLRSKISKIRKLQLALALFVGRTYVIGV